jgi:hypothetical protein
MTNNTWTAACSAIVVSAAIAVMAQTQTPPPTTTPTPTTPPTSTTTPQQNSASSDQRITVTGCLRQAPANNAATDTATGGAATTAGTTGTSGAPATAGAGSSAEAKFVLADAKKATGDSSPAQTYRLVANPAALTPHVGKKLELTGTLVDQAAAAGGSQDATASGPTLRVESGKVLGTSCEQ